MTKFKPSLLLRNHHIQTICANTAPRKLIVRRQAKSFINNSQLHTLDCGDDVRLQGMYSGKSENTKGLVIMIHGWLGHNDSLYLLSAGNKLYQQGYNIFRLNLRDHGDSSHLNKQLFHSARILEVVNAIKQIQQRFPHPYNYLTGFSLGGNFSLRIAARAPANNIKLDQVTAICPVINPHKSNQNIHDGLFIYHDYFLKKWKHSLRQKLKAFPEHNYGDILSKLKTLNHMNEYFVPNHTEYDTAESYLQGYAIDGDYLADLEIPCHIISSRDDPIIFSEDLETLASNKNLSIELTQYGGHCGYIENFRLNSWIDKKLIEIFSKH